MKIPLLLNYAQCKLINKEYYSVIEHCTTVLKTEPGYTTNIVLPITDTSRKQCLISKSIFDLQRM